MYIYLPEHTNMYFYDYKNAESTEQIICACYPPYVQMAIISWTGSSFSIGMNRYNVYTHTLLTPVVISHLSKGRGMGSFRSFPRRTAHFTFIGSPQPRYLHRTCCWLFCSFRRSRILSAVFVELPASDWGWSQRRRHANLVPNIVCLFMFC